MEIQTIVVNVLVGVGSGVGAAIIGLLKKPKDEEFDGVKFVKTVIVGGVTGGIAGGMGIDVTQAGEMLATYPLIVLGIDAVAKIIWRKLAPYGAKIKAFFSQE